MGFFTLFLTALALSADAFAVSISNTMCYRGITRRQQLAASASFGIFQGIMPTLGFFASAMFTDIITGVDHWLALILLGAIGGKMLVEGVKELRTPSECPEPAQYTIKTLLVQAVATSIDALAVGISFAALDVQIFSAAGAIALTTFLCCLVGCALGRRFGLKLGDWAQVVGGGILVGIGLKIFIEHMFFGG